MNSKYKTISLVALAIIALAMVFIFVFGRNAKSEDEVNKTLRLEDVEFFVGNNVLPGLRAFGEPIYGDLDGDGDPDVARWLVHEGGGSGSFYYAAFVLIQEGDYVPLSAVFLGDRIDPQGIEIVDGRALYKYAVRKEGEPFTAVPSVSKSTWIMINMNTGKLVEWGKELLAEPIVMSLDMKKWEWQKTEMDEGAVIVPKRLGIFTARFNPDGTLELGSDCNSMSATFTIEYGKISISPISSTKKYCEGSQEGEFAQALAKADSYSFSPEGELFLYFMFGDGIGTMTFR